KAGFYNGHRYIPATYIDDGAISCVCGHSSECYGITQGWRKGAAGNLTLGIEAWNFHFLVAAQYAALGHHQTHQALFYTFSALKLKRLTAYKCAPLRLPRHRPGKIGLQGRHTLVHIAAVQIHTRFQTQRISRPQTHWRHIHIEQALPEVIQLLCG